MGNEFSPQQRQAIETLDQSLAVWAGAGAGKTRVLVERFIRIIVAGRAQVKEILAITFTNKAAKEMKSRIRQNLQDKCCQVVGTELDFWRDMKEQLQWAPISTIHSLCMTVLRENPVEAVLDPEYAVLDEAEANLLWREVAAQVLARAVGQQESWALQLLNLYGKSSLLTMTFAVYKKMETANKIYFTMVDDLKKPYIASSEKIDNIIDNLKSSCLELISLRSILKKSSVQEVKVSIIEENWQEISAGIERLAVMEDQTEFMGLVNKYFLPLEARTKDKETVKQIRSCVEELVALQADRVTTRVVEDICNYVWRIKEGLDKQKQARRVVTFVDLEHKTVQLLEKYPHLCDKYQKRYKFIMVDEFQDTNEVQKKIIYLLAGGDSSVLQSDRLFIVGDPKQSIYRFRGADVGIFHEVTADIRNRSGAAQIDLDVNYRSTDGILTVVNSLFSDVMGTEQDRIAYEEAKWYRNCEGEVAVDLLVVDETELAAEQNIRQVEGEAIAAHIQKLIDNSLASSIARKISYRDVVILLHSMTHVGYYEAALRQAHIPYYIVGGRGLYDCQEIVDTLNLVRVVENPHNQVALAGVLRSPYFMFTDIMLLKLARVGEQDLWEGLSKMQTGDVILVDQDEQVLYRDALKLLQQLCFLRSTLAIDELMAMAFSSTGYLEYLLSQYMGLQKYANVQKLLNIMSDFTAKKSKTLSDFLQYLEVLERDNDLAESEAQIDAESEDTVRIMTIHKAKGLEFPIVFVLNLERKFLAPIAPVLYNPKFGLGLRIKDERGEWKSPSVYQTVQVEEKIATVLEMKRLLYVAMTRAKDKLVLSCGGKKALGEKESPDPYNEMSNWLKWLAHAFQFNEISSIPQWLCAGKIAVHKPVKIEEKIGRQLWVDHYRAGNMLSDNEAVWQKISNNIAPIRDQFPDRRDAFSPTALQTYRHCPRLFYYLYIQDLPELKNRDSREGLYVAPPHIVGLVVHKVCEILSGSSGVDDCLERAVEMLSPVECRQAVKVKARELLVKYMASDFYQELNVGEYVREVRFTYNLLDNDEKIKMVGIIDCLRFYDDGSVGIVDYKTDQLVGLEQANEKAQEYIWQMAIYSWAVMILYQKPVRDVKLYFIQADIAVDMKFTEVQEEQYRQAIITACRYITEHSAESDYSGNTDWCSYCSYTSFCPSTK